jgi:hypothetical protein
MESTIIIGDIHGSTFWKTAIAENPDCRYVFLGDYLDAKDNIDLEQELYNFQEIIQFKRENYDMVVLLLGNHDLLHFDYEIDESVSLVFKENASLFQNAYQIDNVVFTHAGIVHKWFVEDFKGDLTRNIAEQLNNPMESQKNALRQVGDQNTTSGIFMAGVKELYYPLQGFIQIVGHNSVPDIKDVSINDGRIIFCDSLWNGKYLKI